MDERSGVRWKSVVAMIIVAGAVCGVAYAAIPSPDRTTHQASVAVRAATVSGPAGLRGATGATGAAGPQGLQGPAGARGPRGRRGLTGARGPMGFPGTQGPAGPQGPARPVGPAGGARSQGRSGEHTAGIPSLAY